MKCAKCGFDSCEGGLGQQFPKLVFKFKSGFKKKLFDKIKKFIKVEYFDICDSSAGSTSLYGCTRSKIMSTRKLLF